MERTQLRSMAALTVVGFTLSGVIWFWEPEPELADPDATEPVWALDGDSAVAVEIRRQQDTVRLSKRDEVWWVDAPWAGVADPDTVHDLIDALVEVERGVPIEDPGELAEYGLGSPPVAHVSVTLAGGEVLEAVFGDEAPVGYRTYALSAAGGVVAVGGRPGRSLLAGASTFKDRRVFHFDPAAVRRVSIESAEGRLSVHGEKTQWWLEGFARADPNRVDDLVIGLLNIRIDEFLDLSDTISEPAIVVEVELASAEVVEIKVGDPTPLGVLVEYPGGFGTVFADSLKLLVQGPTDIGVSQAFPIDEDTVLGVSLACADDVWTAKRDGPSWRVGGQEVPAAQDVVDALADAVVHYRREPVPPLGEVGCTVEIEAVDRTTTVDLGQVLDEDFRVAKDRAGGGTFLIPDVDLAVLDQPLPQAE